MINESLIHCCVCVCVCVYLGGGACEWQRRGQWPGERVHKEEQTCPEETPAGATTVTTLRVSSRESHHSSRPAQRHTPLGAVKTTSLRSH
ncbi:hypothetical protein E2C01_016962 [Portunus trituberculatus]|uniref:Secreted protein n=1 Tax=Portunus trituberculatus TaxID=210409 RepID=A0A5B7DRM3_PORTR|nr:hypothetical protein [Portunus trituberculatus]